MILFGTVVVLSLFGFGEVVNDLELSYGYVSTKAWRIFRPGANLPVPARSFVAHIQGTYPTKPRGKEVIMLSSVAARSAGLCSTCNNNNDVACGYRALRGYDALFCELFDISPNGGDRDVGARLVAVEVIAVGKKTEREIFKGLCINCENRETCGLAESEGGVWHCE